MLPELPGWRLGLGTQVDEGAGEHMGRGQTEADPAHRPVDPAGKLEQSGAERVDAPAGTGGAAKAEKYMRS